MTSLPCQSLPCPPPPPPSDCFLSRAYTLQLNIRFIGYAKRILHFPVSGVVK